MPIVRAWYNTEYRLKGKNLLEVGGKVYYAVPVCIFYKGGTITEGDKKIEIRGTEWDVMPCDDNNGLVVSPDYEGPTKHNKLVKDGWVFHRNSRSRLRAEHQWPKE